MSWVCGILSYGQGVLPERYQMDAGKENWLTGRAWNLKSVSVIQQFLNVLGTLSSNGDVPFLGFFLGVIPYLFWKSAHFFMV
jgi:hypothetical protein